MTEAIIVNRVPPLTPLSWLADGYSDLYRMIVPALSFGSLFGLIGGALTIALYMRGEDAWLPALSAGFLLIAPVLAAPFSAAARARENNQKIKVWDMVFPKTASPIQLYLLLIVLGVLFWIWGRAADQLAWLVGQEAHSGMSIFMEYIGGTLRGRAMITIGILYGGALAIVAYTISAITVPLLVDRNMSLKTAIKFNLLAIGRNPEAMLIWAFLIAVLTIIGMATAFLWFVIVFPLLGFASWHAYRDLIGPDANHASFSDKVQSI